MDTYNLSEEDYKKLAEAIQVITANDCLDALRVALLGEKADSFSFKREEWNTCLYLYEGKWRITFVERGIDRTPEDFLQVDDACRRMIVRMLPKWRAKRATKSFNRQIGTASRGKSLDELEKILKFVT